MAGTQLREPVVTTAGPLAHPTRLPYLRGLDGLRGVAVLAVLAFHGEVLDGGFLGVDLFFVLSGFLITALLLRERRNDGAISLLGFWGRRARRLLPVLLAVLVAVAVYAAFIADPTGLERIRGDGFATLLYFANWKDLISDNSYWELFTDPSPLSHAWSLAIEEQFYLFWPLVVALAAIRARRPAERVLVISLVGAVLSALWLMAQYAMSGDAARSYLGTDTRVSAILVGAALAAFLEVTQGGVQAAGTAPPASAFAASTGGASEGHDTQPDQPIEHPLALAGLAATAVLAWMWWSTDGTAPFLYQGGFALHSLAAAVLIATVVHPRPTILHRVFGAAPLVWFGLVSYGLYLWHWHIYVWLDAERTGLDGWSLLGVRVTVSVAVAAASYYLLERPIRTGRVPARTLLVAVPTASVLVAAALWWATSGAPVAPPDQFTAERASDPFALAPRVLIAGDSLALNLGTGILSASFDLGVRSRVAAEPGCSVLPAGLLVRTRRGTEEGGGCGRFDTLSDWVEEVLGQTNVDSLVLVFALPDVFDIVGDDGSLTQSCLSDDAVVHEQYLRAATAPAESDLKVFLVTSPPLVGGRAADTVPKQNGISLDELNRRIACHNDVFERIATSDERVEVIDLAGWTCPEGECRDDVDGSALRPDGLHFSEQSAVNAGRWMLTQIDTFGGLPREGPEEQVDDPVSEGAS